MDAPERIFRHHELNSVDGLKHSRRDELMRDGQYPLPVKLSTGGRVNAWLSSEIAAWQKWRKACRDGTAGPETSWTDFLDVEGDQPHEVA
jgi:predicted DNA-binding transcriptional regulator AlpA